MDFPESERQGRVVDVNGQPLYSCGKDANCGQMGTAAEMEEHYARDHQGHIGSRIACRKCVAGHDPSGGSCDYCDGQGSLDLTLAMVKAADGWDQGITAQAFRSTAAHADTKARLAANNGRPVRVTYNDEGGQRVLTGTLGYDGTTATLDGKPLDPAYVIDVTATGTGDARDAHEGPGKDKPNLFDLLLRGNFPSGAMASTHTAQTPGGMDMSTWMQQMQDEQALMGQGTASPPTPPTPPPPVAPVAPPPSVAPVAPATTTRPRGGQSHNNGVTQGFASALAAQEEFLSPPSSNADAFERKVDEIATEVQQANPDLSSSAVREIAVAAVSLYPQTAGSEAQAR